MSPSSRLLSREVMELKEDTAATEPKEGTAPSSRQAIKAEIKPKEGMAPSSPPVIRAEIKPKEGTEPFSRQAIKAEKFLLRECPGPATGSGTRSMARSTLVRPFR